MPVSANLAALTEMTAQAASLDIATAAGTSKANPTQHRTTPSPPLVVPGGELSVARHAAAQPPDSSPMPVAAAGSRARNPMTQATNCGGTVEASTASATVWDCESDTQ